MTVLLSSPTLRRVSTSDSTARSTDCRARSRARCSVMTTSGSASRRVRNGRGWSRTLRSLKAGEAKDGGTASGEATLVLRRGGRRHGLAVAVDPVVRREVPRVDEERVVVRGELAHRVVGALGDHVGDVAVAVGLGVAVVVEGEVEVVVDPGAERVPVVPARRAHVLVGVAVEELADEAGLVAALLEPRADLLGRVEGLEAAERAGVVLHAVVLGVLTGDQLGARRAAQGVGRDRVGEVDPAVGEQLAGARHPLQVVLAHVVGHHEDDVGTIGAVGRRPDGRRPAAACTATGQGGGLVGQRDPGGSQQQHDQGGRPATHPRLHCVP